MLYSTLFCNLIQWRSRYLTISPCWPSSFRLKHKHWALLTLRVLPPGSKFSLQTHNCPHTWSLLPCSQLCLSAMLSCQDSEWFLEVFCDETIARRVWPDKIGDHHPLRAFWSRFWSKMVALVCQAHFPAWDCQLNFPENLRLENSKWNLQQSTFWKGGF